MSLRSGERELTHDGARQLDRDIADLVHQYQGGYGFEHRLFVPSPQGLAELQRSLAQLIRQVEEVPLHGFWRDHFRSLLRSFSFNASTHQRRPHHYLSSLSGSLCRVMELEGEACLEHCQQLSQRLGQVPPLAREISSWCPQLSPTACQELVQTIQSIGEAAEGLQGMETRLESFLGDAETRGFYQQLAAARQALDALQARARAAAESPMVALESPAFATLVEDSLGLDLAYLLSWYQEDFAWRWEQYVEQASALGKGEGQHPTEILELLSPPFNSAQEMLAAGRIILQEVRRNARAYVSLPEGEACEVIPTPDYVQFCPTAVYLGGKVHQGELRGRIGLNAENYRAFSRASHWGTMAHEGYPGHHAHFVLTGQGRLPETFLLYLPLSRPLVEGVAHRAEMLMAPHHEDDVARLATARRVLFCAARVRGVMELNYQGRAVDEIYTMYHEQLRVNEFTARAQVRAHQRMPGDALSFYTGARLLRTWEADLGYAPAAFTQLVCSYGFVGIETMGAILRLTDEERDALRQFGA